MHRLLIPCFVSHKYNWNLLYLQEFACREVHESSGDWVIYFTNYTELCAFKEILETLWMDANLVGYILRAIHCNVIRKC